MKSSPVLLFLFCLLWDLSLASPTTTEAREASGTTEPLDCSSKFSGDYYGLGVRLGIYFTWLTSWVANTFVREEIGGALDANSIFLFALLVSIFKGTASSSPDKLAYIDGLILMQLCAGYLFGVFSLWGYRTSHYFKEGPKAVRHYGRFGTHCRLILITAISVYGVWFWTYGIRYDLHQGLERVTDENGNPRPPQCYPVYVFFFAKLNVLGGIRIFYMISSIGTTLYYSGMLLAAVAERIRHMIHVFTKEKGHEKRETFKYQTGLTKKELNFLFSLNRAFNLIWILFTVVMVEMTIIWNHLRQVIGPNGKISYPAQLIPMMIGALSFLRIMWLLFQQWRSPTPDDGREENEQEQQKPGDAPRGSQGSLHIGLGLQSGSSPYSPATNAIIAGEDYDTSVARNRSIVTRYIVAYVPWLSQFDFWKQQREHRRVPSSTEEHGTSYQDSPMMTMRRGYRSGEDVGPHTSMLSAPSSDVASPMIDMKSPTSINDSPVMGHRKRSKQQEDQAGLEPFSSSFKPLPVSESKTPRTGTKEEREAAIADINSGQALTNSPTANLPIPSTPKNTMPYNANHGGVGPRGQTQRPSSRNGKANAARRMRVDGRLRAREERARVEREKRDKWKKG